MDKMAFLDECLRTNFHGTLGFRGHPFSNYAKRGGLGYLVGLFYVKGGKGKMTVFRVITAILPIR